MPYKTETIEPGTELLTINMGPSHPSTHGVLRLILTLDGEPARPIAGSLQAAELGELSFAFGEYGEVDGVAWPGRVVVRRPGDGIEVEVRYQTVEVNPPTAAGTFRLDPPADPGTARRPLDGPRR